MQQDSSWSYSSYEPRTVYAPESYSYPTVRFDRKGIEELLAHFRKYDESFNRLAAEGGTAQDIQALTRILQQRFRIRGPYGNAEASLSAPGDIANALSHTGQYDVHFEVRRIDWGLPTYYACRVRQDYWGTYGLVVDDLYRSERYRLDEPRFVKLQSYGRNAYFLRLSQFRNDVARMLAEDKLTEKPKTDNLLYLLGRYVLQGAWHVDQKFSFLVASAFGLPNLRQVVELCYMCLGCDLCTARRYLNDDILSFFQSIYENKALSALIAQLSDVTGKQATALSKNALECYQETAALFNAFLETPVEWQAVPKGSLPLWKLILGNMNRLPDIAEQTCGQAILLQAREKLETEAQDCTGRLLSTI